MASVNIIYKSRGPWFHVVLQLFKQAFRGDSKLKTNTCDLQAKRYQMAQFIEIKILLHS